MNSVLIGDCRKLLQAIRPESVQCVVTSPPYWGLRDYGVDGQLGLEKTPEEYVANMVEVFGEVKKILREEGTLWINIGDTFYGGGRNRGSDIQNLSEKQRSNRGTAIEDSAMSFQWQKHTTLKPKDLCGIPWRVAFALQAEGWYLRQDIIWHKPNPMPESVQDRCTKAHEYLFLLTKSERYYYDSEAICEPSENSGKRIFLGDKSFSKGQAKGKCVAPSGNANVEFFDVPDTRNRRSVWTITTQPFSGSHFATFPKKLVEPCILAGSKPGDLVMDPFSGSGTVGAVCADLGRSYLGFELNPKYAEMRQEERSVLTMELA